MRFAIAIAIGIVATFFFDVIGLAFGLLVGFGIVVLDKRRIKVDHSQPFFGSAQPATIHDAKFFELFGYLCKIDGVVSRNEILGVEVIFERLKFSPQERQQAIASFNLGKASTFDFEGTLQSVRQLHMSTAVAEQLLHLMNVVVANADGSGLIDEERHLLFRIGEAYGLSVRQIGDILMMQQDEYTSSTEQDEYTSYREQDARSSYTRTESPRANPRKTTLERAYETLNIDANVTAKEASKSYRKLRSKFHPDKLPKNVSESERQAAGRKFDEIQRAWDIVRLHYGV